MHVHFLQFVCKIMKFHKDNTWFFFPGLTVYLWQQGILVCNVVEKHLSRDDVEPPLEATFISCFWPTITSFFYCYLLQYLYSPFYQLPSYIVKCSKISLWICQSFSISARWPDNEYLFCCWFISVESTINQSRKPTPPVVNHFMIHGLSKIWETS